MKEKLSARLSYSLSSLRSLMSEVEDLQKHLVFLSLLTMATLVSTNAIFRYLFNNPINNTVSITRLYLLPTSVALILAHNIRTDSDVNVDIISRNFSDTARTVIQSVWYIGIILIGFLLLLNFLLYALEQTRQQATSTGGLPVYLSQWILVIGIAFLTYSIADELLTNLGVGDD